MRLSLLVPAAALTLIAAPAHAHRQWLLPSTTTLAGTDDAVTVDAAISNDLFFADHFPMQTQQVKVWAPDGSTAQIENAATGRYRSTFDVRIDKPGTWKIGTEQASVMGSFKLNGEEWRVGGRRGPPPAPGAAGTGGTPPAGAGMTPSGPGVGGPGVGGPGGPGRAPGKSVATPADIPAGATDVKLTEVSSRNYVFVTAGAPTAQVLAPTGKGLEFAPVTHPDALVADEEAQFRFLIDGKPAANVKVTVVPGGKKFRGAEDAQELTTGADGTVRIKWPVPGMYWLNATATDTHPADAKATDRRMSFITTLEVPAP